MSRNARTSWIIRGRGAAPLVLAWAAVLCGCNTVEGVGEDIQAAASATREALTTDSAAEQPKTHSTNDGARPGR